MRRTACAQLFLNVSYLPIVIRMTSRTENGLVLAVFKGRVGAQQSAEIVVVDLLLVMVDEVSPALLACLALHLILVDCSLGVVVGKLLLEVLVDFVVDLGKA
mgnify:CR=1 FL=1